jgi:hypothetical protein
MNAKVASQLEPKATERCSILVIFYLFASTPHERRYRCAKRAKLTHAKKATPGRRNPHYPSAT